MPPADRRAAHTGIGLLAGYGLLAGKRILITGVATRASIAFAVAELAQRLGAEILLTSFGRVRRITERAVGLLEDPPEILELDVTRPEDFENLRAELADRWGRVDGALHAVGFAPPDALGHGFLGTPAESAEQAFRTSAYSFQALARCIAPLMPPGSGIVGLDFDASRAWPGYDWMGVAKAALEAIARYVALELGPLGIRANLVAAGPLHTMAASGIPAFDRLADIWAQHAPLGWDAKSAEGVAGSVCFLLSDLAREVTGEILHVDGGLHAVGANASLAG
jgi:enoyl-[acyl-carrier protein] reductase I